MPALASPPLAVKGLLVNGRAPIPRRLPQSLTSTASCPSAAELVRDGSFSDFYALLPAPLLEVPKVPGKKGHRVRHRWQLGRGKVLIANELIRAHNLLDSGMHDARAHRRKHSSCLTDAVSKFHRRVLELATIVVSARLAGPLGRSGAHTTASLIKSDRVDRYSFAVSSHNQVTLTADSLDEPLPGSPVVNMLDALPWDEALFYSKEENLLELEVLEALELLKVGLGLEQSVLLFPMNQYDDSYLVLHLLATSLVLMDHLCMTMCKS